MIRKKFTFTLLLTLMTLLTVFALFALSGGFKTQTPTTDMTEATDTIGTIDTIDTIDTIATTASETTEEIQTSIPLDPRNFKGFNLMSQILVGEWVTTDAEEWAFKFMAEEGFNFARIPMEVQRLYSDSEYTVWNDDALYEIDRIIALGQKYDIHILLDLHTLPGIRPGGVEPSDASFDAAERLVIWKDIFYVLSRRYQEVPSDDLSYNLINEPYQLETEAYMSDILEVRAVIREVDMTKRLFIDPNHWTGDALYALKNIEDPNIVASPHFYQPFLATHYLAEWVEGADQYPVPEYPSFNFNGYVYGNYHPELHQPLVLKGDFSKGTQLTIRIHEVSAFADFVVSTENEKLGGQTFMATDDNSFWKEVHYSEEWKIYQNVYDKDFSVTLTKDSKEVRMELLSGDWLSLSSVMIENPNWDEPLKIEARSMDWGVPKSDIEITSNGTIDFTKNENVINKDFLYEESFKQWRLFTEKTGIPVVGCEFGVYNKTSHEVSLRVIEDHLSLFEESNFGFALWNLSGAFGIFDSDRKDVTYELYEGHKLDRKMLELLKKY